VVGGGYGTGYDGFIYNNGSYTTLTLSGFVALNPAAINNNGVVVGEV
jgi:hypothetical protein